MVNNYFKQEWVNAMSSNEDVKKCCNINDTSKALFSCLGTAHLGVTFNLFT